MGGRSTIEKPDRNPNDIDGVANVSDKKLNTLSTISGVDTIDESLSVSNTELFSIFNLILKELKIMNIHLSTATDNEIYEREIG